MVLSRRAPALVLTAALAMVPLASGDTATWAGSPTAAQARAGASPTSDLRAAWTVRPPLGGPLVVAPFDTEVAATSSRHWIIAAGLPHQGPGATPPAALRYVIGSVDGTVTRLAAMTDKPTPVRSIPGTDLFVAWGRGYVGVIDPARPAIVWRGSTTRTRIAAISSTRIWMGDTTPDGGPVCRVVETGETVDHDSACDDVVDAPAATVRGVDLRPGRVLADWPTGKQLVSPHDRLRTVSPVVRATDPTTGEELWAAGGSALRDVRGATTYRQVTFAVSSLGLVRVDQRTTQPDILHGAGPEPSTTTSTRLALVDTRTGRMVRRIGRVQDRDFVGFVGRVALFQDRAGDVSGYRIPRRPAPPPPPPEPAATRLADPATDSEHLPHLWQGELDLPAGATDPEVVAVSGGHWVVAASEPGTDLSLDYRIGDAETGATAQLSPLADVPTAIREVSGSDLFVAHGDGRIGVVDPALPAWLWQAPAFTPRINYADPDRIWQGNISPDGRSVCFATETGEVVDHDEACDRVGLLPWDRVGEMTFSANSTSRSWRTAGQLVDDEQLQSTAVPVVIADDGQTLPYSWYHGRSSLFVEPGLTTYRVSTFALSALGLVRLDQTSRTTSDGAEAAVTVLRLVDPRTGSVTVTLGRVLGSRFAGFAGDVAIFQSIDGRQVSGYRVLP